MIQHRTARRTGANTSRGRGSRGGEEATILKKSPTGAKGTDNLRFVALGGLEEIGRNMMFFEYKDEILIIDMGLQFPEEGTPGIDYIIPNVTYLEAKKKNIKGIIITHGHYDHIGAIPYLLDKLGNPMIYATNLTKEIVMKRQEDFPNSPKPNFVLVKGGDSHQFGNYFTAHFHDVFHNIPEGVAIVIDTPIGKILHPGEFKFDYDKEGKPKGLDVWKKNRRRGYPYSDAGLNRRRGPRLRALGARCGSRA
jgi:ribonuclease J